MYYYWGFVTFLSEYVGCRAMKGSMIEEMRWRIVMMHTQIRAFELLGQIFILALLFAVCFATFHSVSI